MKEKNGKASNFHQLFLDNFEIKTISRLPICFEAEIVLAIIITTCKNAGKVVSLSEKQIVELMNFFLIDESFPYSKRIRNLFRLSDVSFGVNFNTYTLSLHDAFDLIN